MGARRRGLCLTLAGLLLTLVSGAQAAGHCELRVRWAHDPPYSMAVNGRVEGLLADIVSETLARMGCRPVWVELPWARALVELQEGHIDIAAGALHRPERDAYAYFVRVLRSESRNRLYVRVDAPLPLRRATSLAAVLATDVRLGVQIGVVYGDEYARLLRQPGVRAQLTQAASRRSLWQMLDLGRVDAVLASENNARWELDQLGLATRLTPTELVLTGEPTYVMLSRRSVTPAMLERFRQASEALERDGGERRIGSRYQSR